MTDTAARHGVGGNRPPISELLAESCKDMIAEADKWIGSAARAPEKIEDDVALGKFGTIAVKLTDAMRALEKRRKDEKEPYLKGGKEVDAFFNVLTDKVMTAVQSIQNRQRVYMREKERAAREAAEREAEAKREQAAKALAAAETLQDEGKFDAADGLLAGAAAAETQAGEAQAKAEASTADLTRTRADSGALITAKKVWRVELENRGVFTSTERAWALIEPYLSSEVLTKAAQAAVKNGVRAIPGFKIFEDIDPLNRG